MQNDISLSFGEPCACSGALALRAVPVPAGIVGNAPLSAILAGLDMAAQCSGAAVLNRRHHLKLGQAEMSFVGYPVSWPGGTEDIGDLGRGAHGSAVGRFAFHQRHKPVEGPGNCVNGPGGDLRIERGRLQLAMSEQNLDDADIGAILQKMGGKAVP